tara:strand:- start:4235 stop:4522 length:288 start_codon:yes stop_codon:yes gene_type:complete
MSIEKHFGKIDAFKHVIELCDEFIKEPMQKIDNAEDEKQVILALKLVNLTLNSVKEFCKDSIDICENNIDEISKDIMRESTKHLPNFKANGEENG